MVVVSSRTVVDIRMLDQLFVEVMRQLPFT
jgi:hypothetical protein